MPVTVQPYNDDPTLLVYEFSGVWTDDEFRAAIDQAAAHVSQLRSTTRSDGISCFLDSTRPVMRVNPFDLLGYIKQNIPERNGCMVLVVNHALAESIVAFLNRFFPSDKTRILQANTKEDAAALIYAQRAHLNSG